MDKKQALEAMERIFNYCEEIDLHLPEDERTGYNRKKMSPHFSERVTK